ncbi:MAG: hypothetical protein A3H35_01980 [Betaproteobacteria bacterium RIFCSPLOWO2_02_FULL_62_17]|nr:MAG: hypothetical protein A3H35_01980 [Betaproteobacteria bacterium RIFCSPLOWO2_02_FULL_62_17]
MKRMSFLVKLVLSFLTLTAPAAAQPYPSKPIRMIVPAAAAGPTDFLARVAAEHLSRTFGQSVIVENMASAGGITGLQQAARSPADGYTIFIASQGMIALGPFLQQGLPFDYDNDFSPIIMLSAPPFFLVTNPNVPANNLDELLTLLRSKPGQLNYASTGGTASTSHLIGELFKKVAKVDIVHVPYKGNAQAATDLVAGQVQLTFSQAAVVMPLVKSGKLRALAIGTLQRSSVFPDIPTFQEGGMPGFQAMSWFALLTRAGVPTEIITRLNEELNRMLQLPEVRAKLIGAGQDPAGGAVGETAKQILAERAKWKQVIQDAKISLK